MVTADLEKPIETSATATTTTLGLIGASVVVGAAAYIINADPALRPWPALVAWAAAIGLLLAGAWKLTARRATHARAAADQARWELFAVIALTIIALALRVVALDQIPRNFGGDEGEMGRVAREILHGAAYSPFVTGWLSHPMLWFFLQALALRLFGDDVFGLRLLSALIGTAAIPALYLFARPLYGSRAALAAAALLAVYHFHIHFSRLAVNNIVDPLVALITFAAFLHGYRTRSPFSFALAGVTLGVAQHFYMGARLTPLVIAALLLHQLVSDRERLWRLRWHIGLMGLGFLLGIGPLLYYFISHPRDFNARLAMVGVFQSGWFDQQRAQGIGVLQILLNQARDGVGAWTFQPDRSAWYDTRIPLLDQISALLFLIGLAATLVRLRDLDAALLVVWLAGVAIFGGMLLISSPASPRYVMSTPAVCLLLVLGMEQIGQLLRWIIPPISRRSLYVLGSVAVLLLAVWNINFYFRVYTPRNTYGWFNTEAATTVGKYLQRQREPVYVYFFGPPAMFYGNGTIYFEAPDTPGMDVLHPIASADDLPPAPVGFRPVFIFLPWRARELQIVRARYPKGALNEFEATSQDSMLLEIYTPE